MPTDRPAGADREGLRLPGWRAVAGVWIVTAIVLGGVAVWVESQPPPAPRAAGPEATIAEPASVPEERGPETTRAEAAPSPEARPEETQTAQPAAEPEASEPPRMTAAVPEAAPMPAPAEAIPDKPLNVTEAPAGPQPQPAPADPVAPTVTATPVPPLPGPAAPPSPTASVTQPEPAPRIAEPERPPSPLPFPSTGVAVAAPYSPPLSGPPTLPVPEPAPEVVAIVPMSPPTNPAAGARQLPTPPPARAPSAIPPPDLDLLEPSRFGFLPRPSDDGRMPYHYYAQPFRRTDNRPRVALIIFDSGISPLQSEEAIRRLPVQITLAISPYAPQAGVLAERARERGMETMIALPLEPPGYPLNDPGIRSLLVSAAADTNTENLDWLLSRFAGYVGAVGAIGPLRGERFAQMPDLMRRLHDTLRDRGLLYVDPRPGTPTTDRVWGRTVDMVIDEPPTRNDIERRLSEIDTIARLRGSALGYAGQLTGVLIERVVTWAVGLEARGLVLAPASAILRVRQPNIPSAGQPVVPANR